MYKNSAQKEKGVVLYLTVIVMALLLAMVLGLGSIFIGQLNILRGVGNSVIALYAAEAGAEKILRDDKTGVDISTDCATAGACIGTIPGNLLSTYEVIVAAAGGGCGATTYCLKASGTFENSTRKISVER